AVDALARLKVSWNKYLFENVLSRFLVTLPDEYPSVSPTKFYNFWPIFSVQVSSSTVEFCKELLENDVENLNADDKVFLGPPASYFPGNMDGLIQSNSNGYVKKTTELQFLSIANGYFSPGPELDRTSEILRKIGFPVIIDINPTVGKIEAQWKDLSREEILNLFCYVLQDKDTEGLEGLQMIPLADETLETISEVEEDV
ncbi:1123_t:CDS:2, partial [Acaulospora colombiana]